MMKNNLIVMAAVLATTLLIMHTWSGEAYAFLIDRIDAVVNERIITKSEVDRAFDAEVLRLTAEGKKPASGLRKEVRDSLINRILILDDAKKFNLVQVADEEVEKAYESVRQGFPSEEAFLNAMEKEGITPPELKENLRDQVLAAKYVDRRIKSFVKITMEEQKKYYEENRSKFGDKSFDEAQVELNGLLVERETGKKLDDYLNELRAKSSIQLMDAEKMRD